MQQLRQVASFAWQCQTLRKFFQTSHRLLLTRIYSCRLTEYRLWKQLKYQTRKDTEAISKSLGRVLLSACAFSWAHDSVTDDELQKVLSELEECLYIASPEQALMQDRDQLHEPARLRFSSRIVEELQPSDQWDILVDKSHLKVWRRPVANSQLYEYRAYGSYDDISAREFFQVQLDLAYRCEWDDMAIKLELIDTDPDGDSEAVHWVTHFPYPMKHREYLFVRRSYVDPDGRYMLLRSRAVPGHPKVDGSGAGKKSSLVRITEYVSSMLVVPQGAGLDDTGVDYVLTYFDNPQSNIPSFAYNYVAGSGVFDFMEELHQAAKQRRIRSKSHCDASSQQQL